ncbi:MAG: hypothetical protein IIA49_15160, partial [Bacteroidetes bacterium]|nr:hypothetical protein [Bacteroidota bacterium]
CKQFGITGYDQTKVETYALTHDWGHLTGCHPTEDFMKKTSEFDHEAFSIWKVQQNKEAFEGIVDVADLVAMFEGRDPLHTIVDGPFGADRIYFLSILVNAKYIINNNALVKIIREYTCKTYNKRIRTNAVIRYA